MSYILTLTIMSFLFITLFQVTIEDLIRQNETINKTSTSKSAYKERIKTMKTGNLTTTVPKILATPPTRLFQEYLRCRHFNSQNKLPTPYSCPYNYEEETEVCWDATLNGSYAWNTIEYDYGINSFYDGVRHGLSNCTIQRFCQSNGTWAMTTPLDIQCKTCDGNDRPVKFNSISIMIETMSLSLSLLSLTIAILCMINVKYVSYIYIKIFRLNPSDLSTRVYPTPRPPKPQYIVDTRNLPCICRCFLTFRRLHLPRNLLHMNLFLAFIFRSIVKLVFIHLIMGGYTRSMITYTRDHCGNIEIISKSSNLFHTIGCRVLSSLFWYTDAVAQTFIFCEAMFLFTALTSHLFRDRGCLLFVLWGWLSPLVWLTMWIASHVITDHLKRRSTCWLEADNTTYFYYFFYVPYAFYLLINFGIFLFLVRLLYSKYQSNNVQTNRTGNRHLIKSILILIPLFGLHSLFVMWVFYHKNQGHTIWYYIAVIFKAVFGDLQGFFTSLIYFYFNTEIRHEVLRQVQRTLLTNDNVRRSSAGDTLSTRLSVFRISFSDRRRRQSSIPNRNDKQRTISTSPSSLTFKTHEICWRKFCSFICPCLHIRTTKIVEQDQPRLFHEINNNNNNNNNHHEQIQNQPAITIEENALIEPLLSENRLVKTTTVDTDGLTCDTDIIKHEHDDEHLSSANDVTIHQTSIISDQHSSMSNHTPSLERDSIDNDDSRVRSKSDGHTLKHLAVKYAQDNKSLT